MNRRILVGTLACLSLAACDTAEPGLVPDAEGESGITRLPDTFDRAAAAKKAQAAAQILAGVASEAAAVEEFESLVRATKGPHDEAVRFANLLQREDGNARVALRVTDPSVVVENRGAFAKAFRSSFESARLRNARVTDGLTLEELEAYLVENDMQVYWPYYENWDGETAPVVTFDPMNDEEESVAYRLVDSNARTSELVVDEAYAQENPTWVVNISELPEPNIIVIDPGTGGGGTGGGSASCPTRPPNEPQDAISLVKMGWFKTTKNWDSWLNGGSEMYFTHPKGEVDFQNPSASKAIVTTFMYYVARSNESKWLNLDQEYISNWLPEIRTQKLMVHEHDPHGPFTFSGKVGFSIPIPGSGTPPITANPEVSFSATFKSNDPVIYLRDTERGSYFYFNYDNVEGLGTRDCFRVYKGGQYVSFTLPYLLGDW